MAGGRSIWIAIAGIVLLGAAAAIFLLSGPEPEPVTQFVGSRACTGCHAQAFEDWQQSHHRHAMEAPDARSVLGDFQDARFDYFGTTSRFFTRDGQYFVETDNATGELETFRVAYTFGWYPLQQYLLELPDGRLQALSISWDSRPAGEGGQRWFHLYPDEQIAHDDPLHWTGAFQNWNSRCAACHTTALVKGYSLQEDRYETGWKEMTVGCEACHGPGSRHLAWAQGEDRAEDKGLAVSIGTVWSPAGGQRPIPQTEAQISAQLQVCSGCHSRRTELGQPDITAAFADNYTLSPLLGGLYHADGQILEEVYETGSFMQSRMYQNHVSCTNCHEPHSSRVRASGNALCLQCHEPPKYQTAEHLLHAPQSAGAQCVNCHMPEQTFMGVDARRDHSFRVPDPAASLRFGVPNACTQCHQDRNDRWAAQVLAERKGRSEPWYRHTRLIHAARAGNASVTPDLLAYARDAANPAILRAIVLEESARFPSPQQLDAAIGALGASDPLLRAAAASSMGYLDAGQRLAQLRPLLTDPVKSVRLAAARQLVDLRPAQAPEALRPLLAAVFAEYTAALLHNADMPEAMSDLGVFHASQGDLDAALQALLHARKLAPRYLAALLNLSDVYRARGRDDLGEPLLREALQEYPESADAHYMFGLLLVRTARRPESVASFRSASMLAPQNPQYALVLAVALVETGDRAGGLELLEAATRRFPDNPALRQALESYRAR